MMRCLVPLLCCVSGLQVVVERDAVAAVTRAGRLKQGSEVSRLLERLPVSTLNELRSYNALIAACGRVGLTEEALSLFESAGRAAAKGRIAAPDAFTYSSALSALANAPERWPRAVALFEDFGGENIFVSNALLKTLKAAGRPREALEVLERMPERDAVSYTTVLATRGVGAKTAASLVEKMKGEGVRPDKKVYAAAVAACRDDPDAALRLLEAIPPRLRSEHAASAAISVAPPETAISIFESLIDPSEVSYTAAITRVDWKTAVRLLDRAVKANRASEDVCRATLAACERGATSRSAKAAIAVFKHARLTYGLLDRATVNAGISALGAGGLVEAALALFDEFEKGNAISASDPDAVSYSAALAACAHPAVARERWRDGLGLLAEMVRNRIPIEPGAIGAALVACERGGASRQAAAVVRLAARRRVSVDASCYDAAILAQCNDTKDGWKRAISLLREMRRTSGLEPATRTYVAVLETLKLAGQRERADIVYAAARVRGKLSHAHPEGPNTIDLHYFSRAAAACALRAALREANPNSDLKIVVGRGLRSKNKPILREFVEETLRTEHGIEARVDPANPGRLVVSAARLRPHLLWRLSTSTPLIQHPALFLSAATRHDRGGGGGGEKNHHMPLDELLALESMMDP
ncbi:hypothetical protein CTAYLR_001688 [Chrysophaeum taylorii]|uniref:Smr domain-containing protein n=1 Tax=Chrysophaeum taylorii TaxID=2483200 RepID=A0AAD7U5G4_9STRA|nr:hypothetical protein CTAYLR_001688 [Chrysophaeum taylorii]